MSSVRKTSSSDARHPTLVDYVDFTYYEMPIGDRRKLDVGDIFLNQWRCKKCGWIIRSKNRHHSPSCKCGAINIDGGSWYTIISGEINEAESLVLPYKHTDELRVSKRASSEKED